MGVSQLVAALREQEAGTFDLAVASVATACIGALCCVGYACYTDRSVPTYEERQARQTELRDYVDDMRTDFMIHKTRKRIYAQQERVEAVQDQLVDDLEALYDATVTEGAFFYKCNYTDVFVAVPKQYLAQNYNVCIEDPVYTLAYHRRLLPFRVNVGSQHGIPGIDPRGHAVSDEAI